MTLPPDDLGADFEQRWLRAALNTRRQLMAELRDIYIFLEEDDMPLLESRTPHQTMPSTLATTVVNSGISTPPKENPFLPKHILERLHNSQTQASAGLRELINPAATTPAQHASTASLEQELRLRLGPVVEQFLEAHMEQLKNELRVQLRAEMDKIIAESMFKAAR